VDGVIRFWDAASGKELRSFRGHSNLVSAIAVTRDAQRLVTGGWDGIARIWDMAGGQQLLDLDAHTGRVSSLCLTQDNQRLITGSGNRMATVWDIASGEPLLSLKGYTGAIPVAVTPDGQWIITGGDDGTVRVWDAVCGRQLRELTGHTGAVTSIAVTPNGRRLITGGADGTVKLWDAVSGREVLTLKGHSGPITSIAMTSDGYRLITGSGDGTVKIWEAPSPQQVVLWEEQEKKLARRLAPWKRPVSGASHFIQDWLVLAPLALKDGEALADALDREQLEGEARMQPGVGERRPVDGKQYSWQKYHEDEPILNFNRFVGTVTAGSVAYAVCYVISQTERKDLLLQVGSDDQAKMYLNGHPVYKYTEVRALEVVDPIGPVTLRKGTNILVIKVVNGGGDWECCARFVDSDCNPADGLRFSVTPGP
jgi:WD40 repeat protein